MYEECRGVDLWAGALSVIGTRNTDSFYAIEERCGSKEILPECG